MEYTAYDVLVVGTGAAGYNAANRIARFGKKSVALVTEAVNSGTSRNTGSDKQTYYKLGLGGDSPDSVAQMAENLFSCGSVDGDTALCEAALSARCFLNLVELGVPFPVNRYGEYVGYKTDHDPFARATSAGPLTSKFMTEALQAEADRLRIPVFSGLLAVQVLIADGRVCGLLCLNIADGSLCVFRCGAVILATGGPAGIYADSVYPLGHTGTSSLALAAGASLQNMTEWQYGLASVRPRWNVSGTYMQVLPRFVSVDAEGNESEFLAAYFDDPYEALSLVFLKGYQWPFDSKKVLSGSSVIDLLVYRECVQKHRRVFLDYTVNPFGLEDIEYSRLSDEARIYLEKAGACFGTPLERLAKMNQPAIDLYASKGVDLSREKLEIALCAQHNNGGIAVDLWWQTAVQGLFAVGECAGTHGVTRPGGSALNAGQVGSLRAAQYVSYTDTVPTDDAVFEQVAAEALTAHRQFAAQWLANSDTVAAALTHARRRMSDTGGAIRDAAAMTRTKQEIDAELASITSTVGVDSPRSLYRAYQLKDCLLMQAAVLEACIDFSATVGGTRGSALYFDANGEKRDGLEDLFRFCPESGRSFERVQEIRRVNGKLTAVWRPRRPLPDNNDFFETTWAVYRKNQGIY